MASENITTFPPLTFAAKTTGRVKRRLTLSPPFVGLAIFTGGDAKENNNAVSMNFYIFNRPLTERASDNVDSVSPWSANAVSERRKL